MNFYHRLLTAGTFNAPPPFHTPLGNVSCIVTTDAPLNETNFDNYIIGPA